MVARSSNWELLMVPVGLAVETKASDTAAGNGTRHTNGVADWAKDVGSHTPPMPVPEASQVPT